MICVDLAINRVQQAMKETAEYRQKELDKQAELSQRAQEKADRKKRPERGV